MSEQFHFDPDTYLETILAEVPAYRGLQEQTASASADVPATRILELGVGTGETTARVLATHPGAELVGIDESPAMLEHARDRLPGVELRVGRLDEPLPTGPFDLVVSALTIHHLDGNGKAGLFRRIAALLPPAGRLVVADVVVPDDPDDAVTPVDGTYDRPSTVGDQLRWLADAGLRGRVAWKHRDLAVLVADPGDVIRPGTRDGADRAR